MSGYNSKEIINAIQTLKQFNITTTRKNEHKVKIYELKKVYDELCNINKWLFNAEEEYNYREYKLAINLNETKKELDKKLKLCIKYLGRQLTQMLEIAS